MSIKAGRFASQAAEYGPKLDQLGRGATGKSARLAGAMTVNAVCQFCRGHMQLRPGNRKRLDAAIEQLLANTAGNAISPVSQPEEPARTIKPVVMISVPVPKGFSFAEHDLIVRIAERVAA